MMKNKLVNYINPFFYLLFCFVLFLIVSEIINIGFSFNYVLILCICVLVGVLGYIKRLKIRDFFVRHKKSFYIICALAIFLGLICRVAFLFIGDRFNVDLTLSDTGVHWYGAQQLVDNGELNQEIGSYEKIFPYLSPYTLTLSIFMRIFGKTQVAIVLSNILFDLISCAAIYLLFASWKENRKKGLIAATLWMINPLEIIFCGLPLAIVIVNMFVILCITCIYFYFKQKSRLLPTILLALLSGGVLSIANSYRPIFTVFLMAVLVYSFYAMISEKKYIQNKIIGMICMCVMYLIVGMLPPIVHGKVNPYYHGEKSSAAWSVFLGANYDSHGKWNREDSAYFFGTVLPKQAEGDIEKSQDIILENGFDRYKQIIIDGKLLNHTMNKVGVLFGDVKNSIYDFPYVYNLQKENKYYKYIQDFILIYYLGLITFLLYIILDKRKDLIKNRGDNFRLFLMILFVGLFFASLLVEVMNRYSLPFVTIILIMVLGFGFSDKTKKLKYDKIKA